ncbi:MAG: ComEC family competence protein [Mediterranea sp.]|nr:ComEC family competence protein [Mediterranea sp.]
MERAFYFYKYTVFRLLVPFIAGILCGDCMYDESVRLSFTFLLVAVFVFLFFLLALYSIFRRYSSRWVFGVFACLFFLLFGACWQNIRLQQTVVDFSSAETLYRVVIADRPERKGERMLCRARVAAERKDSLSWKRMDDPSVLLYFPLDSASRTIRRGDELLLQTRLALPEQGGNPDEFDYPRYLIHKRISGSSFVSAGKWRIIAHHSQRSIQDCAFDCRDKVLELYRDLGFRADNYAVLSALTVGYKNELSESIRESFSVSGTSHVLALSGLHIGFLYAFIIFFLKRIRGFSVGVRIFKATTVVMFLWGFAFLTGLSPSVVRSVIMFSLIGLSQLSTERTVCLNSLFVAGTGMLIYDPFWLYDVGFQLSFVAVFSILLIQPWLYERFTIRNRLLDKLWQYSTVPLAAQIGTAPLVLLYFHRFPVHFLLANIVVVLLVTIIIYAAIVMLLFSFVPVAGQLAADGLDLLLSLLGVVVRWIESLPFASVDRVWVYRAEVLLFYSALFFLGYYIVWRRTRFLLAVLSVLLVLSAYRAYCVEFDSPRQSLVFYNVRNCPAVHCILPDGRSWLVYADSVPDGQRLTRVASNYWSRLRLSEPVPVVADHNETCLVRRDDILLFGGKKVCIVNDDRWKNRQAELRLPVDYLYVCAKYTGRVKDLTDVFLVRQIVFDPSIPYYRRNALQEECERLNIPFASIAGQSSYFKQLI